MTPEADRDFPSRAGYALVTGGAARLGEAIVRRLASEGWRVAIHHLHSASEARALVRELKHEGCDAIAVACDLTNSANLPVMFKKANAALGFCSLLVNSAAIFEYDDIATVTEESMDAHYAANLRAPILLARHFAEQLPKDAKGLIVNLLDQKVFNLNPDFLSYTIMKTGARLGDRIARDGARAADSRVRRGARPFAPQRQPDRQGFRRRACQNAAWLRQRARRYRRSG